MGRGQMPAEQKRDEQLSVFHCSPPSVGLDNNQPADWRGTQFPSPYRAYSGHGCWCFRTKTKEKGAKWWLGRVRVVREREGGKWRGGNLSSEEILDESFMVAWFNHIQKNLHRFLIGSSQIPIRVHVASFNSTSKSRADIECSLPLHSYLIYFIETQPYLATKKSRRIHDSP